MATTASPRTNPDEAAPARHRSDVVLWISFDNSALLRRRLADLQSTFPAKSGRSKPRHPFSESWAAMTAAFAPILRNSPGLPGNRPPRGA